MNTSLLMLMQTYMGQLFIYALPSVEVSAIMGVLINTILFTFMGFNPTADTIPEGYKWLYTITPQRYSMSILTSLAFGNCPGGAPQWDDALGQFVGVGSEIGCQPLTDLPATMSHMTVQEYIETVFNMRRDHMWADFGYVFVFIAVFRILALLALRYLNFQKR